MSDIKTEMVEVPYKLLKALCEINVSVGDYEELSKVPENQVEKAKARDILSAFDREYSRRSDNITLDILADGEKKQVEHYLNECVENINCRWDHNKNCQEHGYFAYNGDCPTGDIVAILRKYKGDNYK